MGTLINILPGCNSISLPEKGSYLNVNIGWREDRKGIDADELLSKDPAVVAEYFRKNLRYIRGVDFDEIGRLWAAQSVSTTGMVHCNFYHSGKLSALLLGDAAHATVPNIGQGMNTALDDARALDEILDDCYKNKKSDVSLGDASKVWRDMIFPEFSKQRVKEGNALTELSFNTFSLDPLMMAEMELRRQIRNALNRIF